MPYPSIAVGTADPRLPHACGEAVSLCRTFRELSHWQAHVPDQRKRIRLSWDLERVDQLSGACCKQRHSRKCKFRHGSRIKVTQAFTPTPRSGYIQQHEERTRLPVATVGSACQISSKQKACTHACVHESMHVRVLITNICMCINRLFFFRRRERRLGLRLGLGVSAGFSRKHAVLAPRVKDRFTLKLL